MTLNVHGIGTEIVEVARIARMIADHGEDFLRRVFTEHEIRRCRAHPRPPELHAAIWAAKESAFKALGTSWRRGVPWTDVEVLHDPRDPDAPPWRLRLHAAARDVARRRGVSRCLVSLSTTRHYAAAHVLALASPRTDAPPPMDEFDFD